MVDKNFSHWIDLWGWNSHVRFDEVPHLIARALWPITDEEDMAQRVAYGAACMELESEVLAAVQGGALQVVDSLTRGPLLAPLGVAVKTSLVAYPELERYVALRGIGVRVAPHFVTCARPTSVEAELQALAPETRITVESNIGCQRGSATTNAGDYRATVLETIARQAEGHFTLNEAAQVLADGRPGLVPIETVKRFRLAHSKGELRIHQGGNRFPLEVGETIRDFWDTVEATELDTWLRSAAGYGFPIGAAAPVPAAPALAQETPRQRRARLLAMHDDEVAAGRELGALARITKIEKRTRPTADRSNIGKDIKKAREERDFERRGGALARLLG